MKNGLHAALRMHACALLCLGLALASGCSKPAEKSRFPEIAIHVTTDGFVPKHATAPRGQPVTLVITRDTDQTCATQLVVQGIDSTWDLPLHRAVHIDVPQGVTDTLRYVCGMGMERGDVTAR
jgi:plastocyanin domain-containing protein